MNEYFDSFPDGGDASSSGFRIADDPPMEAQRLGEVGGVLFMVQRCQLPQNHRTMIALATDNTPEPH